MLIDQYDVFFIDLDGVVYIQDEPIQEAVHALSALRTRQKRVFFLTNDPVPTRHQFVARLHGMSIDVTLEEIITCGWATARYLRENQLPSAYVLGSDGLKWECEAQGITVTNDPDAAAVVVGWHEHVSFQNIQQASVMISTGAAFIATNADANFPAKKGRLPATGAIVAALETATGHEATIIGKPDPLMFQMARTQLSGNERIVMIGDNPLTDIRGAHRAGLPAILVSKHDDERNSESDVGNPDHIIPHLGGIL